VRKLPSVLVVLCAALVACGGGAEEPPPPPPEQKRSQEDRPLEFVGRTVRGATQQAAGALGIEGASPKVATLEPFNRGKGLPPAIVVHGILPTEGDLDPLQSWLVARGYGVYTFRYDDLDDLDRSAEQLRSHLKEVLERTRAEEIVVVAHSMGGLVSRRSLTQGLSPDLDSLLVRFHLITIASPFGGFSYANFARFDMGFSPDGFQDLGRDSRFISQPGALIRSASHVKVETRETGRTRVIDGEARGDDVVGLEQQRQGTIDGSATKRYLIDLGHVGSVRTPEGKVPGPTGRILDHVLPAIR
jgi:pimeloyl-ACP methyl ester carboxylesterase